MAIDLTDFSEAYLFNETVGTLAAIGENGDDIPVVAAVTPRTGAGFFAVEDPVGVFRSRGFLAAVGDASPRHFKQPFVASDAFDIRGAVSCTIAQWSNRKAGAGAANEGSNIFTIHNPAAANGQAIFHIDEHQTFGANPSPAFFMLDGITPFNFKAVQANPALSVIAGTWNFFAGGYDAGSNTIFNFWGRQTGESYYATAAGFAAGFGYTGAAGCEVGIGQFAAGPGGITEVLMDQMMWWGGRALSQTDLDFLWNNHAGRALTDLTGPGPGGVGEDDNFITINKLIRR